MEASDAIWRYSKTIGHLEQKAYYFSRAASEILVHGRILNSDILEWTKWTLCGVGHVVLSSDADAGDTSDHTDTTA